MEWNVERLSALPSQLWQVLDGASRDFESPLRFAALATASDWSASLRTVVLRRADAAQRHLACHTDVRSAKIRELRKNSQIRWLFYDPLQRIQIIAGGTAQIHHGDAIAREAWQATPLANRANYGTAFAPGTPIPNPEVALPAAWSNGGPTVAEAEAGWANFSVLITLVDHLEWLHLRMEGHRRAGFTWSGTAFDGKWLVP